LLDSHITPSLLPLTLSLTCLLIPFPYHHRRILDVKDENARWLAGRVISSIEGKPFSSITDPFIPPNLPFRNCYRSYLHDEIAGMEQEIQKIHTAFIEGRGKERERRRGKGKEKETGKGRYEDTEISVGDDERQEDGAKNGCHSNGNCEGGGEGVSVDAHSCSENIEIAVGKRSHSQSYTHSANHTHTHAHSHTNCSIEGDSSDSILRVKRKFNDVEKGSVCNTPTISSSTSASISAAATDCANHINFTAPLLSFRSIADESGINVPQGPQSTVNIGIDPGSDSMDATGSAAVAPVPINSAYLERCHNDDFETFTR
jgi:hypothetical protein